MLPKTAITGLAAAAIVALTASATYAAAGGGHGAGNWVQEGNLELAGHLQVGRSPGEAVQSQTSQLAMG